ncbi:MAG: hypothetical protein ACLPN6_30985 [Streptosporangiaceae bacterium]|nr:hypothetical protein [Actinomycetota bacterium]
MAVATGIAELLRHGASRLRGTRLALLGHAASVLPDLTRTLDACARAARRGTAVAEDQPGPRVTPLRGPAADLLRDDIDS